MRKAALMAVAVASIGTVAMMSPAEARGWHHGGYGWGPGIGFGLAAGALAAGAYGPYGYGYGPAYYGYGPGYYGGPYAYYPGPRYYRRHYYYRRW
ncbi:hypothetical protein AFIC_002100 [[Pseudomonas] carboxydohydrogena]|uniref:Sulfur globule protein n=1 Tax=Afipia carboxydohydrogena TaxID=290 RepID=A0ABY8BNI2_AFICR|nr:hypothetical protein [[Pseudomonas] carboxydohydrogena]WEF50556.1 hypothetical protein AFIC_002100 [[Pseudomonas] carboxydohydrogena]